MNPIDPEDLLDLSEPARQVLTDLAEADDAFRAAEQALIAASIARRNAVAAAHAAGFTHTGLGELLGITRQAVADLVKAANAPAQTLLSTRGETVVRPIRPVRGRAGARRAANRAAAAKEAAKPTAAPAPVLEAEPEPEVDMFQACIDLAARCLRLDLVGSAL